MRLDLFLKVTRILKQRTVAKQACDAGAVRLNGDVAKASAEVHTGDRLRVDLPAFLLEAEVLDVPRNTNVPRRDVERYLRIDEHRHRDRATYVFGEDDGEDNDGADPGPEAAS